MPIADVVSVPVRAVAGMIEGMQTVANLREENLRLQEDVKRLSRWWLKAEILQTEKLQLRSVSGVIIPDAVRPVSARVIAINADSFAHSVMVNAEKMRAEKRSCCYNNRWAGGMVIDAGARHAQCFVYRHKCHDPCYFSSSSWPATTVVATLTVLICGFCL